MKSFLVCNRWQTPDGTILESIDTHDFVGHHDANGEDYFIDGGCDYIRMSVNKEEMKSLCVYSNEDIEKVREGWHIMTLEGGKYVLLKDISNWELMSLLTKYGQNLFNGDNETYFEIIAREIQYRYENEDIKLG